MPDTILIIDDDVGITAALTVRLRAVGYNVVQADCGLRGLQVAEAQMPDLIVLDIRMPDIDGFEVCRRLKASKTLRHIPVLFLSANVKESAHRQAIDAGGQAFLSKPFDSSEVAATIKKLLAGNPDVPPSLLIVDDDDELVRALRSRFAAQGYHCVTAGTGSAGLTAFREHRVDVVLTDLEMPGGDGVWLARALRERSDVPIIVMTGFHEKYREELDHVKGVVVVKKPIEAEDLIALVDRSLTRRRAA